MIHILTNTKTILKTEVRPQESRIGDESVKSVLSLQLKQVLTDTSFTEQQYYLQSSATAAYVSFNKLDQRIRFRASVNLVACNNLTFNFTQGSSSSGLGYALACFDAWWRLSLTKDNHFRYPIFATGEVLTSGQINPIGHIVDKIESVCTYVEESQPTISNFYFCYPLDNDAEIPQILRNRLLGLGGELIPSNRLQHTLGELLGSGYDGDPLGRWLPFKGLNSFEYEDSVRFFGRDKDVDRLYADIDRNNGLLIVSGASGTGKSSLIKAGLIPKLEKEHGYLHWASCTPETQNATQGILNFILQQIISVWNIPSKNVREIRSIFDSSIKSGIDYINKHITIKTSKCLIFIDKYEENFIKREKNIDVIASEFKLVELLTESFSPLNVVLAIRNEYQGRLLSSHALSSSKISNITSQFSSKNWKYMVCEQALFSGITFEQSDTSNQSLDELIIEEAIQIPFVMPMVNCLLEQLFIKALEENQSSRVLLYKHYVELGGLSGVIASLASKIIEDSNSSECLISNFFLLFIDINLESLPCRKSVSLEELEQVDHDLYQLVNKFINNNLIICADTELVEFELIDESFFSKWELLQVWFDNKKEYLIWRKDIESNFTLWKEEQEVNLLAEKLESTPLRQVIQGMNDFKKTEELSNSQNLSLSLIMQGAEYDSKGFIRDKRLKLYLKHSSEVHLVAIFISIFIILYIFIKE